MSTSTASSLSPPSRRRRRITRLFAASGLVLALGLLLGLGSCTAVLDLDDYGNVADEMCSLLDRCYAKRDNVGCLPIIQGNLDQAPSEVRAAWLESFTSFACLESCSAGRHCLNIAPLCAVAGSCLRRQDCCGFLEGNASCVAGECCKTRGSECDADGDCCLGAGACLDRVCGGTPCLPPGDTCSTDGQCCTKICKRGECAKTICEDDKAACAEDQDCCSHFCDPTSSLCAEPPKCGAVGAVCVADTDCCVGTPCLFAPGSLAGTCAESTCSHADVDCSADEQCCSGRCDPLSFFCVPACLNEGATCAQEADCCGGHCDAGVCAGTCSTTFCAQAADCCSNSCVDGVCAAACNPPSVHTPCMAGGPLAETQDMTACVDVVCEADAYCCCGAWDDLCVSAATALQSTCTDLCK